MPRIFSPPPTSNSLSGAPSSTHLCGSKPTVGVTLLTSPPRIAATSVDLPAPSHPSMMSVLSLTLSCGGAGATFSLRRRARLRPMRFLSGSLAARCIARSSSSAWTALLKQPRSAMRVQSSKGP